MCCSLDAISFLIPTNESFIRRYGNEGTIDLKPVSYACNYLSVLQEEKELRNLLYAINDPYLPEDLKNIVEIALEDVHIMNMIIELLKDY